MSDKKTILFLDDDEFILDMYSLKLTNAGFDVKAFSRPEDALSALEDGLSPDIMLIDIIMPQMSGLEFLENIRAKNLASNSKVVMLTNQSEPSDMKKAEELGVSRYIIKANTIPSEVVEIVKQVLNI